MRLLILNVLPLYTDASHVILRGVFVAALLDYLGQLKRVAIFSERVTSSQ